jgi:hypothetical protein
VSLSLTISAGQVSVTGSIICHNYQRSGLPGPGRETRYAVHTRSRNLCKALLKLWYINDACNALSIHEIEAMASYRSSLLWDQFDSPVWTCSCETLLVKSGQSNVQRRGSALRQRHDLGLSGLHHRQVAFPHVFDFTNSAYLKLNILACYSCQPLTHWAVLTVSTRNR